LRKSEATRSCGLPYPLAMSKVRVSSIGVSIDGFGAGPDQSIDHPLGVRGKELMEWAFATRTFQTMFGSSGGSTGIDEDFAARGLAGVGAWILGRNMFGPVRGPWPDDEWKGWWGTNPPYHVPAFVLTHHARDPIEMEGGTTFHFVTDGIHAALDRARAAAGDKDVRIGGGVATIREFLRAGLVDEMHLALGPALLGTGEALLAGIDLRALGFTCTERAASPHALHVVLSRDAAAAAAR
jgi:dihydrofolate reductase